MTGPGADAIIAAMIRPWLAAGVAAALAACGDDGGPVDGAVTDDAPGLDAALDAAIDAPPGARPHPLYPPLDLDALPGDGGAAGAPYRPPALPVTTRTVTIASAGAQAATDLLAACRVDGTAVTVPDAAGNVGTVFLGGVDDCDVTLGPAVVASVLYLGHDATPAVNPSHRVRVRGGQLGQVLVDPGTTDVVLDGVVVNNAVVSPLGRANTAIFLIGDREGTGPVVERFAVVNSIVRVLPTAPIGVNTDGAAYLGQGARDVFFANDNIVTAGNRNSWGFLVGGGRNVLLVDLAVRVSIDKLVRLEDAPIDYVYVKGGTWMREATLTGGGLASNDAFAQRDDRGTDHVYLHDATVYLLPTVEVTFGASRGVGQNGKRWEARRLHWWARSSSVVSDAILDRLAGLCAASATCDYGSGTHLYDYDDALALPAAPWRPLPAFADDDPDHQPIAP